MERFDGKCEPFADVDVTEMVAWIKSIPFEEWPQQTKLELMPAMVTDLSWCNFGKHAIPVMHALGFDETQWFNPMLSAVMPGHSIPPHKDQQSEQWLFRVHVPLLTNNFSVYGVEGKAFRMIVGKAYKIDTTREHEVFNKGKTPRVHFMFDVRN